MSGSKLKKEVETRGWLSLVRGSFRVGQQATLDASESGVPVVNGDRSLVVAGLINQARRLCLSFLSESTPPPPSFYFDRGGRGRKELFLYV